MTRLSISPVTLQPLILRGCAPTHSTRSPLSYFSLVLIPYRPMTYCGADVVWVWCGGALLQQSSSTTERGDVHVWLAPRDSVSAGGSIKTGADDRCNGPLRWMYRGNMAANRDAGLFPRLVQYVLCRIFLYVLHLLMGAGEYASVRNKHAVLRRILFEMFY